MELIKKLDIRKRENGFSVVRFGLFYCHKCKKEVERGLYDGKKYKSCGCWKNGQRYEPEWVVWHGMKLRCYTKTCSSYRWYGARGIKVCEEWRSSSKSFIIWARENGYEKGLEIDRIDPNGDYEPSNCRFVRRVDNLRARRSMKLSMLKAEMIRDLHKTGNYNSGELSQVFGVSDQNIRAVIRGILWNDNK